jgi:hypothetical protein
MQGLVRDSEKRALIHEVTANIQLAFTHLFIQTHFSEIVQECFSFLASLYGLILDSHQRNKAVYL